MLKSVYQQVISFILVEELKRIFMVWAGERWRESRKNASTSGVLAFFAVQRTAKQVFLSYI